MIFSKSEVVENIFVISYDQFLSNSAPIFVTELPSILPRAVAADSNSTNWKIEAAARTVIPVFNFTKILAFDFAGVPHSLLCMKLILADSSCY